MSAHDMPADAGDVEALAEVVGHVLSEYLDDAAPLNERRYVVAARHVLSVDGSPGMTAYFAARDAAQRAERDAEWRARIPDIIALKCAEARADEREQIAQAIEAERDSHFSNTVRACYDRAAAIARAGTAGGSECLS